MQQTERTKQHEHRNYQIHFSRQKVPTQAMVQHLMHGRDLGRCIRLRSFDVPLLVPLEVSG